MPHIKKSDVVLAVNHTARVFVELRLAHHDLNQSAEDVLEQVKEYLHRINFPGVFLIFRIETPNSVLILNMNTGDYYSESKEG